MFVEEERRQICNVCRRPSLVVRSSWPELWGSKVPTLTLESAIPISCTQDAAQMSKERRQASVCSMHARPMKLSYLVIRSDDLSEKEGFRMQEHSSRLMADDKGNDI